MAGHVGPEWSVTIDRNGRSRWRGIRIKTCHDEEERQRLTILQDEFTLEMTMIRMNLEHLLKRYSDQLEASSRGEQHFQSPILTMDDAEALAIDRAKRLYARAYQLQTGWL